MGPELSFYLLLFLLFAGAAWFVYRSLCDEQGEFLGDYARWLVRRNELQFTRLRPGAARAQILAWTLGPAAVLALMVGHPLVVLLGAAVGYHLPRWLVEHQLEQRRKQFDGQLVDALVLLSNALRSGLSLIQAIEVLVQEMPPPISQEFELVLREQRISAVLDDALQNLGERIRSKDLDIVLTSILTLRETGGSLPETFDTLTHTIRERKKVEGRIEALTALGVTQGMVACVLPYFFLLLMGLIQPDLVRPLLQTPVGWFCIGAATILDLLGYIFIRRTVRIDV